MSKSPKMTVNDANKLKPAAVIFSYFNRFFALTIVIALFIILLILVIGDDLARNLIGYFFYLIATAGNNFVDKKNTYELYQLFSIFIKVSIPLVFLLISALLFVLPVFISKSRGYRIFTGVVVMLISIIFLVGSVLLVELKKYFPKSSEGFQTIDIFYYQFYDELKYNSFLVISSLLLSSLFIFSSILLFIEAILNKKGYIDFQKLTFNKNKSKPLIIKFIDGDVTFEDHKNKKQPKVENKKNKKNEVIKKEKGEDN